ncbi:MAG: binding-protein-dependent transport system inner rane component [Firmicutes bacterium]|nr:binding-protein-dependent transport system inner rane component [Bacillota bacterium]
MLRYITTRIFATIPTLVLVSFLVFLILRLVPGDPVRLMFGMTPPPESEIQKIRHEMGMDRPLLSQYASFMGRVMQGDFGRSYRTRQEVSKMIQERLPRTLKLAALGMLIATLIGILSGVVAAANRGSWLDTLTMSGAVIGVSVPQFWFGMMLILLFAVHLRWFPVAGSQTFSHVILPAITLGLTGSAVLARVTRAGMIEVLNNDYIRTARAKGVQEGKVNYRHALKNVMIPVVTILGLQLGGLLSGAIVVETVFGFAGIGQLAVYSLNTRDYPVIQAVVLLTAVGYVLANLLVDVAYAMVDPRIRY